MQHENTRAWRVWAGHWLPCSVVCPVQSEYCDDWAGDRVVRWSPPSTLSELTNHADFSAALDLICHFTYCIRANTNNGYAKYIWWRNTFILSSSVQSPTP